MANAEVTDGQNPSATLDIVGCLAVAVQPELPGVGGVRRSAQAAVPRCGAWATEPACQVVRKAFAPGEKESCLREVAALQKLKGHPNVRTLTVKQLQHGCWMMLDDVG